MDIRESKVMEETWGEKVERLRREIAERQAELASLVLGDPSKGVSFPSAEVDVETLLRRAAEK